MVCIQRVIMLLIDPPPPLLVVGVYIMTFGVIILLGYTNLVMFPFPIMFC